ncbi:HD-GYP domain-containing protein [Stieleria varia]|uniref:Cyclic di-GMP phosphodiesterase response regulator RpfG n=1 Tax=Stieleria varia TaxID=2528005 RepID=A0A5C6B7Q2_9BACT|nr:HD-GYP domain-containing protein [Stieleria varia]TWU07632.1 Cyclic di-GMP phosphodiesterase response regulator RpfG [Stieleria varia]
MITTSSTTDHAGRNSLQNLDSAVPLGPPEFGTQVAGHPDEKNNCPAPSLQEEVDWLSDALASRFEELSLIHGLTQRLTQTLTAVEQSSQIIRSLLQELAPCIDSQSLALHLTADDAIGRDEVFDLVGESVSKEWMLQLATIANKHSVSMAGEQQSVAIVNQLLLNDGRSIRVGVVPIRRRDDQLGQMIAIRSIDRDEFGTIEADMMQSTSMMLAVHLINQRQYLQLERMFQGTIQSLVSALDAKDKYTSGHSDRVSLLAVELAKGLGYTETQLANIRMGGILHDIGKIGVQDSVLQKPGRLTDEEFDQIKQHPALGYDILKGIQQFHQILPAVRHHHESWDGSGYPDGLAGLDIPRDAQIMAVADAFDAMTSDRPYRSGMPLEKVREIFLAGRGVQWAADVVDVLLSSPSLFSVDFSRDADPPVGNPTV